jgi:hypothetical protein
MTVRAPFHPNATRGQTVAPAAASAQITIGLGNKNVCFTNLGAAVCYVRTGAGAVVATTADYPVLPNSQIVLSKDDQHDSIAFISATGTTLHIICGEGW